jgi:16S rRNA (cytidine1402-2'-O)-methyltransferase
VTGELVLVATPIGNLGDLSPRAVEVLAAADAIACEDPRRTGRLLAHAGVDGATLIVVNDHTEERQTSSIIDRLDADETIAVVTDAGTPGISDPGAGLVAAAVEAGHRVSTVPGPAAAVSALVMSGLSTTRWVFEGFLPRKGAARRRRLEEVAAESRTLVFYEAPHRVERTLTDLADTVGPDRRVAVAREMTKLHEEVWRGTLSAAISHVVGAGTRGEYVLVVEGAPPSAPPTDAELLASLADELAGGASRKDAVSLVAKAFGVGRNRVYDLATSAGDSEPEPRSAGD